MSRPTVTLCMIVKDEEHIIRECLDSMIPYIDRFDITDTGSTDRTKKIIREWADENNIKGEVHDAPWEGFGKSRTRSLKNCEGKADYAWVIDADDFVQGDFKYPENFGDAHSYALNIFRGNFNWWRNQIFRIDAGWEYVGVLHEYADAVGLRERGIQLKTERLQGNYQVTARTMGSRTKEFGEDQSAKYLKDAETIVDCLTNPENPNYEPDNQRYLFYAAQSYYDAGDNEKAYAWYKKRAEAEGWEEEQWYAVYRMGLCMANHEMMKKNPDAWQIAQDHLLQAWNIRPHRAEPLLHLARTHRLNENPRLAYMFAKQALEIEFPQNDILFLCRSVYEWEILDEIGAVAHTIGQFEVGYHVCKKLLEEKKYPEEHHERIFNNFKSYEGVLVQRQQNIEKQKVEAANKKEDDKKRRERVRKLREEENRKAKRLNKKARKIRSL